MQDAMHMTLGILKSGHRLEAGKAYFIHISSSHDIRPIQ